MSNETDLDWLARDVYVWPTGEHQPWCYVYWKGGRRAVSGNCITVIQPCVRIEKSDWLSRRAELQNKPSWALAPEWADWLAQDAAGLDGIGAWWWFRTKPTNGDRTWSCKGYSSRPAPTRGEVLGDWRDTLERRPDMHKSELKIDTSAERVQKNEKSMHITTGNEWFERGELPPIGIAVQLWHGGTYAYDCELIAKRGNDFVLWNLTWDRPDSADCMMCEFKPIPTERDKLVELIKTYRHTFRSDTEFADAILAAGFKRGAA